MTNSSSWSYADNGFGPQTWQERYKIAKGNLQSPIDIETAQVEVGENVGPIQFQYMNIHSSTITNDGRHLQVTLTRNESAVTGGPLADRYQLAVIRFRWGSDNDTGSEHSVDGQKYPLEVQLIHWNKDLYKNIGQAMVSENGLCIIGVLCQVTDEDSEAFRPIIDLLSRDENKGCFSLEVKSVIDPNEFIRDMTTYWTYQGSLTTPPLTENVTWVVSQNIMSISEKQIKAFRSVRNSSGVPMADHCRPLCPQNERLVRLCTCVVKSPSTENHTDFINNYSVDDANSDIGNTVYHNECDGVNDDAAEKDMHQNGADSDHENNTECDDAKVDEEKVLQDHDTHCYDNDEDRNDAAGDTEKVEQDQDGNCHGKDKECSDANKDAEKALQDQDYFHGNDDECNGADSDSEKALHDEDANRNSNDEECNDAVGDAEKALQDQEPNCHGNDEECNDANEDAEKTLQDQEANYYGNDEDCNGPNGDAEKALQDQEPNCHGNDEDCNDPNGDAEKALRDQEPNCHGNDEDCNDPNGDAEKALQNQEPSCHGNDEDCNDGKGDAEKASQDQEPNCHGNDEDCNDAKADAEKALQDQEANCHGNDEDCNDTSGEAKKALQVQEPSSHGNDEKCCDAEMTLHDHGNEEKCDDDGDDLEKSLRDENANFQANEKNACASILDYGKELEHLELVDNEDDC